MAVVSAGNGTAENPTSGSELRQPGFCPEPPCVHLAIVDGRSTLLLRAMEEQGRLIHPYFWKDILCVCSLLPITVPGSRRVSAPALRGAVARYVGPPGRLFQVSRPAQPPSFQLRAAKRGFRLRDFETPIVAVRGNCDAEVDLMLLPFAVEDSAVIAADGLRIVAQHGHHLPSCPHSRRAPRRCGLERAYPYPARGNRRRRPFLEPRQHNAALGRLSGFLRRLRSRCVPCSA